MNFKQYFLLLISLSTLLACESLSNQDNDELKPRAHGRMGDIFVVMDSALWNGYLGEVMRETFETPIPNLSPPERRFRLQYVNPLQLTRIHRTSANMIFLITLDTHSPQSRKLQNYFTKSSLEQISDDTTKFSLGQKNEFARGQEVLYLFSKNEEILASRILENQDVLREYFERIERRRLRAKIYKGEQRKSLSKNLMIDYNFTLRIPYGYQVAHQEDDFIWFRNMGNEFDKNIFIAFKPYKTENAFTKKEIARWRENITSKYIFEDPENKESYITIDSVHMPFITKNIHFNDMYTIKVQGWWATNTVTMGGPFISFVTLDEELNRLYYIEGFVYSPGNEKRDMLRELEAIIYTFKSK